MSRRAIIRCCSQQHGVEEIMGQDGYDAIVVGARCAGSPTAMLLARKGYRVLVVDRATFPSDTLSTHILHPPGVAALERWGLLDRLVATGCPPIDTYAFDFGPFTLSGAPGTAESPIAYCPRRTVLDKILVDAASEAGAEVRERFTVEDIIIENDRVVGVRGHSKGGDTVTEQRPSGHWSGRTELVRRTCGRSRTVQRETGAPLRLLHLLEWTCRCTAASRSTSAPTAVGQRPRRTMT